MFSRNESDQESELQLSSTTELFTNIDPCQCMVLCMLNNGVMLCLNDWVELSYFFLTKIAYQIVEAMLSGNFKGMCDERLTTSQHQTIMMHVPSSWQWKLSSEDKHIAAPMRFNTVYDAITNMFATQDFTEHVHFNLFWVIHLRLLPLLSDGMKLFLWGEWLMCGLLLCVSFLSWQSGFSVWGKLEVGQVAVVTTLWNHWIQAGDGWGSLWGWVSGVLLHKYSNVQVSIWLLVLSWLMPVF